MFEKTFLLHTKVVFSSDVCLFDDRCVCVCASVVVVFVCLCVFMNPQDLTFFLISRCVCVCVCVCDEEEEKSSCTMVFFGKNHVPLERFALLRTKDKTHNCVRNSKNQREREREMCKLCCFS